MLSHQVDHIISRKHGALSIFGKPGISMRALQSNEGTDVASKNLLVATSAERIILAWRDEMRRIIVAALLTATAIGDFGSDAPRLFAAQDNRQLFS